MNGKTVDSLYLMGYFYITSIIFPIHLVYGRFACTTNSWCTHDVSMTYFYYAFKLYDGEHKRLAVNERVTKRKVKSPYGIPASQAVRLFYDS